MDELAQKLVHKTQELDFAKTELKLIKEFRRKRSQMQKDLEEVGWQLQKSLIFGCAA